MNITVLDELRAYIDPLTPEEHEALERSILAEGCRDALVLWGEILVDGHNRYGICQKHGIPFNTMQHPAFKSMEDVHLWMIDQHLGRRSVSDFQRGVLALRKKDILSARSQQAGARTSSAEGDAAPVATPASDEAATQADQAASPKSADALTSREALAKAARISATTISQIEKIQKTAAPELVAAVKSGDISINAAAIVATLPVEEQVAAAAGGKKELRQAAKQIREAKAQARAAAVGAMLDEGEAAADDAAPSKPFLANQQPDETDQQFIARLQRILQDLQAENVRLKARVAELTAAA